MDEMQISRVCEFWFQEQHADISEHDWWAKYHKQIRGGNKRNRLQPFALFNSAFNFLVTATGEN